MAKRGKVFIDTNLFIYALDRRVPAKRKAAAKALRAIEAEGNGVVSTQVFQEAYVAGTTKLGIAPQDMKQAIVSLRTLEVVQVDVDLIQAAIDCSILQRLSFWDSLIIVAAEKARCTELWTEDLNHGQRIQGIRIHNPFM
ncbi:MAG TPA: PIN domain-containing protein [Kiritimatiellia bacterium]|nr:PIN domain-containing protein [Kiritimatiellia bacterium]HMP33768.1 PIN domain-containing protein [Kiritimatiellia bacterium]